MAIRATCLALVTVGAAACGVVPATVVPDGGSKHDPVDAGGGSVADAGTSSDVDSGSAPVDSGVVATDAGLSVDAGTGTPVDAGGLPDPVLFVHGINGDASNFDVMVARLKADGWPADRLMARTFPDPKMGCNVDNANLIQQWANELMTATHTTRIDVVAHSMGSLSSRRYVKDLGGTAFVNTLAILGGMNHGLWPPCLNPLPVCVWKELCATGPYVSELNKSPATPGPTVWVSIAGGADSTVPNSSSYLDGAENIVVPGVEHSGATGLLEDPTVYTNVVRVLQYPGH